MRSPRIALAGIMLESNAFAPVAEEKGLDFTAELEEGAPATAVTDEQRLQQVLRNLLSNAIKFTPQGGEVWIKVGWTSSGGQYLSVRDNGPGIPEEEIPVVLSSFGQGTNAIKTAEQGAGLGLPIVNGLIDLHGGTFKLRSKLREGTEVIVTFPATRVMSALPSVDEGATLQPAIGEGAGSDGTTEPTRAPAE